MYSSQKCPIGAEGVLLSRESLYHYLYSTEGNNQVTFEADDYNCEHTYTNPNVYPSKHTGIRILRLLTFARDW